jgi:Icc-related predicted phosphoesterase
MKICAVSDQHGILNTVVPECDLLIVAGDNCPDMIGGLWARTDPKQQLHWFHTVWMAWRYRQPAKHCIVTWGNHDYCGSLLVGAREAALDTPDTEIVVDRLVEHEGVKIWCSPWSKQFMHWAFMMEDHKLYKHLKAVPKGIDILVSHDPPFGYGDFAGLDIATGKRLHYGSKAVLWTVERVKPKVVISGHVHEGYGVYNLDLCEKHGAKDRDCECTQFHSVTIYNCAMAGGRASQGTLHDVGRIPMEFIL